MLYIFIDDTCSKRQFKLTDLKSSLEQNIAVREKNNESVVVDKFLLRMFEKGIPFETIDLFEFFEEGGFVKEDDLHDSEDSLYEQTEISGEEYLNELFYIKDCTKTDLCIIIQGLPTKYNENYFNGDAWCQCNILSPLKYYMEIIEDKVIYRRAGKEIRKIFTALYESETFNERLYELCKETINKSKVVKKDFPKVLYKDVFMKINEFLNGLTMSSMSMYNEADDKEFEYRREDLPLDYCCFYENENNEIMQYQSNRHNNRNGSYREFNIRVSVDDSYDFNDPYEYIKLSDDEYNEITDGLYKTSLVVCPKDEFALNERCHMVIYDDGDVCPKCGESINDETHQVKKECFYYQRYFEHLKSKGIQRQFLPIRELHLKEDVDKGYTEY